MLKLLIGAQDGWDETKQEFVLLGGVEVQLEHSLVSLSKWEESWEKPFLTKDDRTDEETLDYIQCMVIGDPIPLELLNQFKQEDFDAISKYIHAKHTATWFAETTETNPSPKREIITSEIVYYWMVALTIPFECQYWHLNRLLTLIQVCNEKNKPADKKGKPLKTADISARKAENARRRAEAATRG